MSQKRILIVDDEEAILSVLKNSLKKLGLGYEVVTAPDGSTALTLLRERSFDLIVTDYKMAGMNGLELLESIRKIDSDARVILMTAYGSQSLENEVQRLRAYRYLTKPLEVNAFRQVVIDALGSAPQSTSNVEELKQSTPAQDNCAASRPGVLVLSDKHYRHINTLLMELNREINARCIFLTTGEGRFIARVGNVENLPLEQIASLIGGGIATMIEAGHVIDGDFDAINLAYREGKRENLFVINIGRDLLLIIITSNGTLSTRLGMVWYYARQTAFKLQEKLEDSDYTSLQQVLGENIGQAIDDELDKLVQECFPLSAPTQSDSQTISPLALENGGFDQSFKGESPTTTGRPLLTFAEAVKANLISESLSGKPASVLTDK
jgi:two-component system response regulator (stage 0 sporulation protein F)